MRDDLSGQRGPKRRHRHPRGRQELYARPLSPAEWIACPFCTHAEAVREFLSLEPPTRPARVVVRVYTAQRKPVAAARGASGLAGRPPGGSSSL